MAVAQKQAELTVLIKAKDLCSYIMTITRKSPKEFRFSFVSRLQNLSLSVVENIIRANELYVTKSEPSLYPVRMRYQRDAITDVKILGYFALLSMEQKCILFKQYEQISEKYTDCLNLLKAWMISDKKRMNY
jgi:hypothetical protein